MSSDGQTLRAAPKYSLAEVAAFLYGSAALDGVWYSERHPTEKGAFWWRKHLKAALAHPTPAERHYCERCGKRLGSTLGVHICTPPGDDADGWMPIETAPKHTEHGVVQHLLLGYAPDETHEDGFVSQGYWMEADDDGPDNMGHDAGFVDVHFTFFSCGRSFGAESYRSSGLQPTHWRHLPTPPAAAPKEPQQ